MSHTWLPPRCWPLTVKSFRISIYQCWPLTGQQHRLTSGARPATPGPRRHHVPVIHQVYRSRPRHTPGPRHLAWRNARRARNRPALVFAAARTARAARPEPKALTSPAAARASLLGSRTRVTQVTAGPGKLGSRTRVTRFSVSLGSCCAPAFAPHPPTSTAAEALPAVFPTAAARAQVGPRPRFAVRPRAATRARPGRRRRKWRPCQGCSGPCQAGS